LIEELELEQIEASTEFIPLESVLASQDMFNALEAKVPEAGLSREDFEMMGFMFLDLTDDADPHESRLN